MTSGCLTVSVPLFLGGRPHGSVLEHRLLRSLGLRRSPWEAGGGEAEDGVRGVTGG